MTDPFTAIGIGAAAYAGKDVVTKLLGPTADYLGEGLRDIVKRRSETLERIFKSAVHKVGERIDEPGIVPPKILKGIISDGSFATDDVEIEYFAGVLAASRTRDGRDDRGVRALKTIQSMSSDQIRTHYILYSCLATCYYRDETNINDKTQADKLQVLIGFESYLSELGVLKGDDDASSQHKLVDAIPHCLFGLLDEGLISNYMMWGSTEKIKRKYDWAKMPGIVIAPTRSGFELFRLGLGVNQSTTNFVLLDSAIQKRIDKEPQRMGARRLPRAASQASAGLSR